MGQQNRFSAYHHIVTNFYSSHIVNVSVMVDEKCLTIKTDTLYLIRCLQNTHIISMSYWM